MTGSRLTTQDETAVQLERQGSMAVVPQEIALPAEDEQGQSNRKWGS